ncbi:MAG: hypothetical protein QXJ75_02250 [Candidatus Bathyarchaeia archaeon]
MVEAVLKFGGSLGEETNVLLKLAEKLSDLSTRHRLLVIPGGGRFADAARWYSERLHLSDATSHRIAVVAMDQYGLLLSEKIRNSRMVLTLKEAVHVADSGKLPILLPSRLMRRVTSLPPSWDVTSDSIAAYIARTIKTERLVLITDVDGVFTVEPKLHRDARLLERVTLDLLSNFRPRTCVDSYLPKVLKGSKLRCHIVNGRYPDRVCDILEGRPTVSTEILI